MSIRDKNCYICGEPFKDDKHIKQDIIDRKPRRVHSDCKNARDKALQDFFLYESEQ